MRNAPPAVEVTLGTGRRERGLVAGLYALAAAVLAAWVSAHLDWPLHAAWPLCAAAGAAMGCQLVRPLRGALRWDGAGWSHLPTAGQQTPLDGVDLQMDLGGWLLVRTRPTSASFGAGAWCGITAREAGLAWHGLRLALYHGAASPQPLKALP